MPFILMETSGIVYKVGAVRMIPVSVPPFFCLCNAFDELKKKGARSALVWSVAKTPHYTKNICFEELKENQPYW
jgi:hypothetical protein